jgi:hypothetical protein
MKTFIKGFGIFNFLGITLVVWAGAVFITGLCVKNDFGFDEAMLVQGIFTRNFAGIAAAPPDFSQSAPLGYLFILKLFSLILGATTFAVRLPSVLAAFGIMFFAYRIARDLIVSKIPSFYAGASVLCTSIFSYSMQAKQYSLEAMCVLLCVWLLGLYWQGKASSIHLALIFSVMMWFSFTSVLFICGGLAVIVVVKIIEAAKRALPLSKAIGEIIPFVITLVSVLLNLALWVLPVSAHLGNHEHVYWDQIAFPLIPTSKADLKLLLVMAKHMISPFGRIGITAVMFSIAALFLIADKRSVRFLLHRIFISIYITLAVGLVASHLGYFPMAGRIWIFIYPLCLIGIAYITEILPELFQNKTVLRVIVFLVCFVCIADVALLTHDKQYVRDGQQLSASIDYINVNMKPGDYIFVETFAIPQYSYLTNYETMFDYFPKKNEIRGNTIFAARIVETTGGKPYEYVSLVLPEAFDNAVNVVSEYDRVWLLFAHRTPREEMNNAQWQFLAALKAHGTVTLVHEYAKTPLYKFEKRSRQGTRDMTAKPGV